jgi:hypothetical protein
MACHKKFALTQIGEHLGAYQGPRQLNECRLKDVIIAVLPTTCLLPGPWTRFAVCAAVCSSSPYKDYLLRLGQVYMQLARNRFKIKLDLCYLIIILLSSQIIGPTHIYLCLQVVVQAIRPYVFMRMRAVSCRIYDSLKK